MRNHLCFCREPARARRFSRGARAHLACLQTGDEPFGRNGRAVAACASSSAGGRRESANALRFLPDSFSGRVGGRFEIFWATLRRSACSAVRSAFRDSGPGAGRFWDSRPVAAAATHVRQISRVAHHFAVLVAPRPTPVPAPPARRLSVDPHAPARPRCSPRVSRLAPRGSRSAPRPPRRG